jgi:hypothetical protein
MKGYVMKFYIADTCNFPIKVETDTDAVAHIRDNAALDRYIQQYGNVTIVRDNDRNLYRVPAFADKIERYSKAKQIDCQRWGCE